MKRTILLSLLITTLSILFTPVGSASAANPASFTLVPSTNTSVQGSSFTISVYENGDNVNVVTTSLTYNAAQVQLIGTSCGGSFASSVGETNGQTCFTSGGTVLNGNILALTATFKSLADSGSASIGIASNSKIVSAGANTWNGASSTTTVALAAPAVTPPAQTTTGGTTTTSTQTTTLSTPTSAASTQAKTTPQNQPSTTGTTAAEAPASSDNTAAVKSASTTKAAVITAAPDSGLSSKTAATLALPFLIGFIVFLALTSPVIFTALKRGKMTNFLRQLVPKKSR